MVPSVPCLSLESRQNDGLMLRSLRRVYHACRWNQGKTVVPLSDDVYQCTMPVVGIKAKLAPAVYLTSTSVPCLSLESRQNDFLLETYPDKVYHACRWNQGKTRTRGVLDVYQVYHACRWNQGKTRVKSFAQLFSVYHACRWNQGKTRPRGVLDVYQVYHACRWNQGKTGTRGVLNIHQVYHACRWNQGKTSRGFRAWRPIVYHACRWNQGKTR